MADEDIDGGAEFDKEHDHAEFDDNSHDGEPGSCPCGNPLCAMNQLGRDGLIAWRNEQMELYGWYTEGVFGDTDLQGGISFHTHGLKETRKHPDFEIVVPLPMPVAHAILAKIVERIDGGERFQTDVDYPGILKNFSIRLVMARENDRTLYRIILPDPNGVLDEDKMNPSFAFQYKALRH